ncbi:alpha/beta fold hydrolase [Nesterenkonia sp.]|uniref:alpha/beta fold hydrolase n=1 Tax=Nesterenkonia sp. TaxID=704201 RepID=UPI00262F42BC|nr:alpha/beta fold hydrolase [Nesterenkonia sp.]
MVIFRPIPAAAARSPFDVLESTPLPGLDPQWSRVVTARTEDGERGFHVLDTAEALAQRGITPTGTILAVHGNPTWSYLWRGVIAASLEQARPGHAWRVIAPDQLDMGFSERLAHPEPPSAGAPSYRRLEQRLGDLDALMDALDVDAELPLVTLGHDWGGIISLGWAVRHQQAVDAAVCLNTAVDHPSGEPVPPALRAAMAPGVLAGSTVVTDAFLRVTLALAEGGLSDDVAAAYRAPYVSHLGRGGIGGFVADIPALAAHRSRGVLEEISAGLSRWSKPALLIWGPKDPVFRDRYLQDLMERIPHADLHRFEGAGHLVSEDRDVAGVLFDWLGQQFDAAAQPSASPAPAAEVAGLHQQLETMSLSWRRDRPAAVDMSSDGAPAVLTWAQLSEQVEALAAGLHSLGVRSGDRVSLLVPPGNSLTVVLYACLRLGAVAVVADAGLGVRGMTRAVRSARPDWIIGARPGLTLARTMSWPGRRISTEPLPPHQARLLGTVASVERLRRGADPRALQELPHPEPEHPAAVLFTSGSTGPAKGVVYTHRRLGALVALLRHQFAVKPGASLIAGFAPFALLGPAIGATSVTPRMSVTKPSTLTAEAVAAAAAAGEATMFFGSPAALRNVVATADRLSVAQREDLGRIRLVLSAGAPVHPRLLDQVQEIFPAAEIHTPYGMTEGLLQADIRREQIHEAMKTSQPGVCVGRPVAGVRFALAPLQADGTSAADLVEPEQAGGALSEIVVSAAHLKAGYDRLWHTDWTSRRDTRDGLLWHRTGDVGHIDDAGRLWIQGRLQHVITTAAGPVGPGAVETPVDELDQVARSAAVGVGPVGAQAVVVILEPAEGRRLRDGRSPLARPEVAQAVRAAAGEVSVSAVLVVDWLPTDIRHNSKIDRTALAAWAEKVLAGERVSAP